MEDFQTHQEGKLYSLGQVFILLTSALIVLYVLGAGSFHNWVKGIKYEPVQNALLSFSGPVKNYLSSLNADFPVVFLDKTFHQFAASNEKKEDFADDLNLLELSYEPKNDPFLDLLELTYESKADPFLNLVELSYESKTDPLADLNLLDLSPESQIDPAAYTQARPLKVLAIGDSLLESAFFAFNQRFNQEKNIKLTMKAIISSTLIQPKYIDWPKTIVQLLSKDRYDAVIVFLGTNDNQTVIDNGKPYLFKTPEWFKIHKERMTSFIKTITASSAKVYWVGIPPVKVPWDNDNKMMMNGVYEKICQECENVKFVPTQPLVGDAGGKYTQYLKVNNAYQKVRMDDGYHFAYFGAKIVTDYILAEIKKDFKVN